MAVTPSYDHDCDLFLPYPGDLVRIEKLGTVGLVLKVSPAEVRHFADRVGVPDCWTVLMCDGQVLKVFPWEVVVIAQAARR